VINRRGRGRSTAKVDVAVIVQKEVPMNSSLPGTKFYFLCESNKPYKRERVFYLLILDVKK